MKVWIIQTGEPIHIDNGKIRPMRAMNLSDYLIKAGHKVTLWTSAFDHAKKSHRSKKFKKIIYNNSLEILLIPSIGYSGNISVKRLLDHFILGYNLKKKFSEKDQDLPDIAFIGYPPIETAYVGINFLKKHNIPTILDIKDLWPSLFLEPFPKILKPIARLLFHPYFYIAKKTIRNSYTICSMSEDYINWTNSFSKRKINSKNIIAPLSTRIQILNKNEIENAKNWWKKFGIIEKNNSRFYFVGNINSSYDFKLVRDSLKKLKESKIDFQFIICGEGSELEKTKSLFDYFSNVVFPGWIDYPKIKVLGELSNSAIIPYKNIENFQLNMTNKVSDALSLGTPIISSVDGLLAKFIEENNVGFTCTKKSGINMHEAILKLIKDKYLREKMSKNCIEIYNRSYNADNVYKTLVKRMEKIIQNKI